MALPQDTTHTKTSTRPTSIPIPITRTRSSSLASSSSSNPPDLSASPSSSPPQGTLRTPFPLSPTSPTLSKFLTAPLLSTSPTASRLAGYFGPASASAVEDDAEEFKQHVASRRMSTGWAGRPFPPTTGPVPVPASPPHVDQGGLMRRFSLSGAFGRPFIAPPPTAPVTGPLAAANERAMPTIVEPSPQPAVVSPTPLQGTGTGRGRTLTPPKPKRRSVSPMSERILKGQFDGFV